MTLEQSIDVALGFDASYVPHAAATIASVAVSTQRPLRFLLLHVGVSEGEKKRVEQCAPRAAFDWVGMDDPRLLALRGEEHYAKPATYFRLALPKLAPPTARRVVYLDCDLVVLRDIGQLFDSELGGRPIGAVCDPGVDAMQFATRWSLEHELAQYFNAGVLVIDLTHPETTDRFASALEFSLQQSGQLPYCDQDALNHEFWGNWRGIAPAWNVQRHTIIEDKQRHGSSPIDRRTLPALVHFTSQYKPWLQGAYHPYAWLYWYFLYRTPFTSQVSKAYGVSRSMQVRLLVRFVKNWPLFGAVWGAIRPRAKPAPVSAVRA